MQNCFYQRMQNSENKTTRNSRQHGKVQSQCDLYANMLVFKNSQRNVSSWEVVRFGKGLVSWTAKTHLLLKLSTALLTIAIITAANPVPGTSEGLPPAHHPYSRCCLSRAGHSALVFKVIHKVVALNLPKWASGGGPMMQHAHFISSIGTCFLCHGPYEPYAWSCWWWLVV